MNRSLQLLLAIGFLFVAGYGVVQAQEISPGRKSLPLPGESFRLDGHDAFIIGP